jgi:hypothetical protein
MKVLDAGVPREGQGIWEWNIVSREERQESGVHQEE